MSEWAAEDADVVKYFGVLDCRICLKLESEFFVVLMVELKPIYSDGVCACV